MSRRQPETVKSRTYTSDTIDHNARPGISRQNLVPPGLAGRRGSAPARHGI